MLRGPLLRRAAREQRTWLMTIGALLLLNLVVYLAVIRPLSQRVSSVTERTQTAETELANARLAQMRAKAALTGKSEAATKLDSFYHEVLPADFSAARRLFFPWVEQVARNVGLEATSSSVDVATDRDRQLTQFSIQMQLTGSYAAIREFIHRLERAPRFVVIDRVTLQEDPAENALSLKLELSTFYKGSAQ
jgi:Tfp pilus assembly protein PilO